jgi:hypothetical protein
MDTQEKAEIDVLEDVGSNTHVPYDRYGNDDASKEAFRTIQSWTPEQHSVEERRLVRRLDLIIGFPIVVLYILNYLDRNSIAQGEYISPVMIR